MKKLFFSAILCILVLSALAQSNKIAFEAIPSLSLDSLSFSSFNEMFNSHTLNDIKIVGIGLTSHTASEPTRFSNKLMQYMILMHGFRIIALPFFNWKLNGLNSYLTNTDSYDDAKLMLLMKQIFDYTVYCTEENKELIKWVKKYNVNHLNDPVQFKGIIINTLASPAYYLAKYIIPMDRVAGLEITKRRAWNKNDSLAYVNIVTWYAEKYPLLKKKLSTKQFIDLKLDIENVINTQKSNNLPIGRQSGFFNDCLLANISDLTTVYKKILLCTETEVVSRSLIKTDSTRKSIGILLGEKYQKGYYTILTDFSNKADLFSVDTKTSKLDSVQITSGRNSSAYLLSEKYKFKTGIIRYHDLIKNDIPVFFNFYSFYNNNISIIIEPKIQAFNALVVFENEGRVKFLKIH